MPTTGAPDTQILLGREAGTSVYVHVPFCAHTCDFCAFYQVQPRADDIRRYLGGIRSEALLAGISGGVDTMFWGGGTPGLLHPRDLEQLGGTVLGALGRPPREWTVEIAPGSARPEKLRMLKDLGVTRISMGVQSFDPRLLEALGRQHSLEQVRRAIDWVREVGFDSFNLDLIFGIPGQSLTEWEADLHAAIREAPDHISTYCLTFEEDTALYLRLLKGKHRIDREAEARYYEVAHATLAAAGFRHYEVSNFAREGHLCTHNLVTWLLGWWAGLGPSAASQQDAFRGANPPDLERWLTLAAEGRRAEEDRTALSRKLLALDRIVFGLRTDEGVPWSGLGCLFTESERCAIDGVLRGLAAEGRAQLRDDGSVVLTPAGFLIADAVGAELLSLVEG